MTTPLPQTGSNADPQNVPSGASFAPPASQRLGRNPMLPQHPASAALDAQYASEEAILRANVSKSYADILQQLGYTDEAGNFIPGSVEANAARQRQELQRSSDLAAEDATHTAQQQGTLFSGLRGTAQARSQYPFQNQIAQLGVDVPQALGRLHEQASGLIDQYTLQNNQYLAAAAARAAAAITASGGGGGTAGPPAGTPAGGGGGAPAPPSPPPPSDLVFPEASGPGSPGGPVLDPATAGSGPTLLTQPGGPILGNLNVGAVEAPATRPDDRGGVRGPGAPMPTDADPNAFVPGGFGLGVNYAPAPDAPVPGQPAGVTNANLASVLFDPSFSISGAPVINPATGQPYVGIGEGLPPVAPQIALPPYMPALPNFQAPPAPDEPPAPDAGPAPDPAAAGFSTGSLVGAGYGSNLGLW